LTGNDEHDDTYDSLMGVGVRSDLIDAIRREDVWGELQGTGGRMEKHDGGSVEEASKTTINFAMVISVCPDVGALVVSRMIGT